MSSSICHTGVWPTQYQPSLPLPFSDCIISGKQLDFSLPLDFPICNMRIRAYNRTDRINLGNTGKASGAQLVLSPRAFTKGRMGARRLSPGGNVRRKVNAPRTHRDPSPEERAGQRPEPAHRTARRSRPALPAGRPCPASRGRSEAPRMRRRPGARSARVACRRCGRCWGSGCWWRAHACPASLPRLTPAVRVPAGGGRSG